MLRKSVCLVFCVLPFIFQKMYANTPENQTTKNFSLSIGSIQYIDALRIPSGLPGANYSFLFNSLKNNKNKSFEFMVKGSYSKLQKNNYNSEHSFYNLVDLKTGIVWCWNIPTPNLFCNANIGIGEILNSYFANSTIEFSNPFGGWSLNSTIKLDIYKNITQQLRLNSSISSSLFALGHFEPYQDTDLEHNFISYLKYYVIPNNIVSLNNYKDIELKIDIQYKIKNTSLKLGYEYYGLKSTVFDRQIIKQVHNISLGLIFNKL